MALPGNCPTGQCRKKLGGRAETRPGAAGPGAGLVLPREVGSERSAGWENPDIPSSRVSCFFLQCISNSQILVFKHKSRSPLVQNVQVVLLCSYLACLGHKAPQLARVIREFRLSSCEERPEWRLMVFRLNGMRSHLFPNACSNSPTHTVLPERWVSERKKHPENLVAVLFCFFFLERHHIVRRTRGWLFAVLCTMWCLWWVLTSRVSHFLLLRWSWQHLPTRIIFRFRNIVCNAAEYSLSTRGCVISFMFRAVHGMCRDSQAGCAVTAIQVSGLLCSRIPECTMSLFTTACNDCQKVLKCCRSHR